MSEIDLEGLSVVDLMVLKKDITKRLAQLKANKEGITSLALDGFTVRNRLPDSVQRMFGRWTDKYGWQEVRRMNITGAKVVDETKKFNLEVSGHAYGYGSALDKVVEPEGWERVVPTMEVDKDGDVVLRHEGYEVFLHGKKMRDIYITTRKVAPVIFNPVHTDIYFILAPCIKEEEE